MQSTPDENLEMYTIRSVHGKGQGMFADKEIKVGIGKCCSRLQIALWMKALKKG